jgi:hypothetical protein
VPVQSAAQLGRIFSDIALLEFSRTFMLQGIDFPGQPGQILWGQNHLFPAGMITSRGKIECLTTDIRSQKTDPVQF